MGIIIIIIKTKTNKTCNETKSKKNINSNN